MSRLDSGSVVDRTPSERVDVCVIGGGPGGAIVAHRLAERGHDVVLLEAGPRFDFADRIRQMEKSLRPAHDAYEVWDMGGRRDRYTNSGSVTYPLNRRRVKGIGGSTLAWGGRLGRFHEKDFEMQTRYGVATDWPISYADVKPYYAAAERAIGAAGPTDNPFEPPRDEAPPMAAFEPSYADSIFTDACDKVGITVHGVLNAINSEPYDGRSPCQAFGTCTPVCPSGAKYSADVHVQKAEEAGARVIDRATVQSLEHDADGEVVEHAVYATPSGRRYEQEAHLFVLAAGGVETPRLLLLSKSETYPSGLANSSGLVGRYFMERPVCGITARVDQRTRQNLVGFGTGESHQFYDYESGPPGSIKLEFKNIRGPTPVQLALSNGSVLNEVSDLVSNPTDAGTWGQLGDSLFEGDAWGDELLASMRERFGNYLGIGAAVEGLPKEENSVTLHPRKTDNFGNPIPDITWTPSEFASKTMDHAMDIMWEIMDAVDAKVESRSEFRFWKGIGHHMGTTRMGEHPDESVVDEHLRTHDLDNLYISSSSVFVTSGAMQPTLTIAALALRLADHLDSKL